MTRYTQLSFPDSCYKDIHYETLRLEMPIVQSFIEYYNEHRTPEMPIMLRTDES